VRLVTTMVVQIPTTMLAVCVRTPTSLASAVRPKLPVAGEMLVC
jgi:hypothetical protein